MRQEIIGSVTTWDPGYDTDWAYQMACGFLAAALGEPPYGVTIEVVSIDHDLGKYPMLAVEWEDFGSEPREYIRKAEHAIFMLNSSIDWASIRPSRFWALDEDE